MPTTTFRPKRKRKLRIKTKGKSYSLRDSALFNLSTKKHLEKRLGQSFSVLMRLAEENQYRLFFLDKPDGSKREIQAPKWALDVIHTRLASLLGRVKMPDHVHSGVKGRSNITNAEQHIGDHPVLTMDIRRFYPSVSRKSIYYFFRNTMQVAPDVSGLLANLCSYNGHLPTGSRLSMMLAYWSNRQMFSRLAEISRDQGVTMTTYVDDLTFSGRNVNRYFGKRIQQAVAIAGLEIHPDKTCLYPCYAPKCITGVIVDANGMRVRNKHHKAINTLFHEMDETSDDDELAILQGRLVGRLQAAGQIDPSFKARARTLLA